MDSSAIKAPSAGAIDKACQRGHEVTIYGQEISGASTHHNEVAADRDWVWVCVGPDYTWRQVQASHVIISEESLKGATKMAKSSAVQEDLPGVEQPKVPALERLIKRYQDAKIERMGLTAIEVEAKQAVMKKMHELDIPVYKRPGKFPFKALLKSKGEDLKVEEVSDDDFEEAEGSGEEAEAQEDQDEE